MRTKVKLLTLSAVLATVALALLPGMALATLDGSCRFYGPVTVDGENVPDGTVVTTWLEDPHLGPWTTTTYTKSSGASWYVVNVDMDDPNTPEKEGGVDGEEVCFSVNYGGSILAAPSNTWQRNGFIYHPLRLTIGVIPGDANGDGVVDTGDITKVKRIIMGIDPPTPGADANQDGVVDTGDITKIKRIIMGIDC